MTYEKPEYDEQPVWLRMAFHLPRPKSCPKSRTRPSVKPDLERVRAYIAEIHALRIPRNPSPPEPYDSYTAEMRDRMTIGVRHA